MSESEVGWWDWVQNAKEKVVNQSSEVLEFVKKDIEEFSKVVSDEASSVVSTTASTLKEKLQLNDQNSSASQVKKSVSGFLSHVAEVFTPSPDDEDQEAIMIWNQQPVTLDRLQASIYAFCSTPSNFVKEPDNEHLYEAFLQTFQIESHEADLPKLLLENSALNSCYSTLVPAQISHTIFWHRYFYEVQRLERAEEKRQEMKKRAMAAQEQDHIVWEDEEDAGEKVSISEQMQKQLLEDYEREMQEDEEEEGRDEDASRTDDEFDMAENLSKSDEGAEPRKGESKSSTPSSKDTEEEWEKVEPETSLPQTESKIKSSSAKGEDWEDWQ